MLSGAEPCSYSQGSLNRPLAFRITGSIFGSMHVRFRYLRQFDRSLWGLSFGWFVAAVGFAAAMPFISIYFHSRYGMSVTEIGGFFGVLAVVRSLLQAVGGEISDRVQRRSLLIFAQSCRALSFAGLAVTIYWDMGFWPVASALFVQTVFGSIFHPAANAMVSDLLPPEQRLDGYAVTRSAGNFGWAIGPAIGGFVAAESYGLLFVISAVMAVASALVFWLFVQAPRTSVTQDRFRFKDLGTITRDPLLARHCILTLLLFLVVAQLIVPFSVYSVEMVGISQVQLGTLYTINGLLVVALQIPVTRLLGHYSLSGQMALGGFIYAIGYGMVGALVGYEWFIAAIVIVTLGEISMSPPSLTLLSRLAPDGRMGRYMGIYGVFLAAGWSLGPLYGGFMLDSFTGNPALAWIMISSLAAISGLGYMLSRKKFGKAADPQRPRRDVGVGNEPPIDVTG